VEVEPLGEPTGPGDDDDVVMLTALFRLEPSRPLKRELMTSTARIGRQQNQSERKWLQFWAVRVSSKSEIPSVLGSLSLGSSLPGRLSNTF
jgi:hypothetical protein